MKISVRQICFIMLVYTAVSKLLTYPTSLSFFCGRDLLFPAALDFAISAVVIWAVSYLCSRCDKTFFELLEGTFGNVAARVIYGFFALFFIVCTILPLIEQKLYVHAIFYDTVPSLLVFLPFFFFSLYAASRGFENIGRCADICLPIFLFSILFIFAMSLQKTEWSALLPILKTPLKGIFTAAGGTLYRFAEPCYLLMFMGHFKYKKGDAAKITLSYVGAALFVLFFLVVFYGTYGEISASRQFAVSKISLFFPAIDMIGRIDLIALYILEIAMLFALVLNIQLAVHCIVKCTGYDHRPLISVAVNAVLFVLLITLNNKFNAVYNLYYAWMWIVFLVFADIVPLLAWALRRRKRNA